MKPLANALATAAAIVATLVLVTPAQAQEPTARSFVSSMHCVLLLTSDGAQIHHDSSRIAVSFLVPTRVQTESGIEDVWIDLSLSANGFAAGTFVGAGPFAPGQFTTQFFWDYVLPGRRHYYRLNGRTASGWTEIGRGVFDTPDCRTIVAQHCSGPPDDALTVQFSVFGQAGVVFDDTQGVPATPLEQWVDLSLTDNGFARGSFLGAGPFPGQFAEKHPLGFRFEWPGIAPGRVHYFRVNTRYDNGIWLASAQGSFLSLDCPGLPPLALPAF